ncbi:MAG: hypothetical protein FWD04_09360 [Conexibacteraceae bacterium]|nr:hypothetical protein [Conexibacteraceae bacterium]
MPKQQRAIRIEQKSQLNAMESLQSRSDEELESETRYRAAAQAILGARKAEKFDAKAAREHFQKALAAARPQERMQIRRMADASLALAERRSGDLKAATAKLPGVEVPTGRQLFGLRVLGLVAPPASAGILARIRGIVIVVIAIAAILALAFGIVEGIGQAAGGISLDIAIFYALALLVVAGGVLVFLGRRRQRAALAKRREDLAARSSAR